MEYVSIDIETTGLDEYSNQMIEFGAIIEDTHNPLSFEESKKFHAIIKNSQNEYYGNPIALAMNQRIFNILANRMKINEDDYDARVQFDTKYNIVDEENFIEAFYLWCSLNLTNKPKHSQDKVKFIAAGKNFGKFDLQFLNRYVEWNEKFEVHHRSIDPGSIFWRPLEDKSLPSLSTCLERVGENTEVAHDAIQDAWQVILALRGGNNYGAD